MRGEGKKKILSDSGGIAMKVPHGSEVQISQHLESQH